MMRKSDISYGLLIVSFVFMMFVSCGARVKKSETNVTTDNDMSTGLCMSAYKDSVYSVGDTIEIDLSSNHTTGYHWTAYDYSRDLLDSIGNKYVSSVSSPMMCGGGGRECWFFVVKNEGRGEVRLRYGRGEWSEKSVETDTVIQVKLTK